MRVQLNLASRPFVELGPLYLRLRILIILLAVVAVPLWLLLGSEKQKAAEAQARLAAVEQSIQAIETRQTLFQAQMREPKNAAILSQSQFLNQMFAEQSLFLDRGDDGPGKCAAQRGAGAEHRPGRSPAMER